MPPRGQGIYELLRATHVRAGFEFIQTVHQSSSVVITEQLFDVRTDPFETTDHYVDAMAVPPVEPYASNYALLLAELDAKYPAVIQ